MPTITNVLCPVDRSPGAARALAYASALAKAHGAHLHVLEVIEQVVPAVPIAPLDFAVSDAVRQATSEDVQKFAADAAKVGPVEEVRVRVGHVAREILADAEACGADLIVMGTRGRSGFERLALGSVAEKILHAARCPVLVVPPGDQHPADRPFRTILCPTDFSEAGNAAVEYAAFMGQCGGTSLLLLLNVIEWPFGATTGDDAVTRLRESLESEARDRLSQLGAGAQAAGLSVQVLAASGQPGREVTAIARARLVDLIVMGVTGRGAIDLALLGSTTQRVVRHAPCPVLAVRS
jgi:nucleotide-binding universal stress UspA family protein